MWTLKKWIILLSVIVIAISIPKSMSSLMCSLDINRKCLFNLSSEACPKSNSKVEIRIGGSTSLIDINYFLQEKLHEDGKNISVIMPLIIKGSQNGIDELKNDDLDIAAVSRDLEKEEEKEHLIQLPIGGDDIAVIVDKSNPVKDLTFEEVKKIFQCKIKNWQDVRGTPGKIEVINRAKGSGTRDMFQKIALNKEQFCPENYITTLPRDESTPIVKKLREIPLREIPLQGISYVSSLYALTQKEIKVVKINHLLPKDKNYPYHRQLYYVYKYPPKPETKIFIDYIKSCHGKKVLKEGLKRYSEKAH